MTNENNLQLFSTATEIVHQSYPNVTLFFAEGKTNQDIKEDQDEIALWEFHFYFPNVWDTTVLLTYGQGHFLLPIKQSGAFNGKTLAALAPKITLDDALDRARKGGFTGILQGVEVYRVLYPGAVDPMYIFYGDQNEQVAVNGNTGALV